MYRDIQKYEDRLKYSIYWGGLYVTKSIIIVTKLINVRKIWLVCSWCNSLYVLRVYTVILYEEYTTKTHLMKFNQILLTLQ
jgi:hypothetical protein